MYACITRETFVFLQFFSECFIRFWNSNYVDMHVDVEIKLYRHVDMEKNMPTTALVETCVMSLHKIYRPVEVGLYVFPNI